MDALESDLMQELTLWRGPTFLSIDIGLKLEVDRNYHFINFNDLYPYLKSLIGFVCKKQYINFPHEYSSLMIFGPRTSLSSCGDPFPCS